MLKFTTNLLPSLQAFPESHVYNATYYECYETKAEQVNAVYSGLEYVVVNKRIALAECLLVIFIVIYSMEKIIPLRGNLNIYVMWCFSD